MRIIYRIIVCFLIAHVAILACSTSSMHGPDQESVWKHSGRCPCTLTISRNLVRWNERALENFDVYITASLWETVAVQRNGTFEELLVSEGIWIPNLSMRVSTFAQSKYDHFRMPNVNSEGQIFVLLRDTVSWKLVDPEHYTTSIQPISRQLRCPVQTSIDAPRQQFSSPLPAPGESPAKEGLDVSRSPDDSETLQSISSKIQGGSLASLNLVRYMAAIVNPSRSTICSGVLISKSWVLSAAHCQISRTDVVFLNSTQAVSNGERYTIRNVFSHPEYKDVAGRRQYDIAVVQIAGIAPRSSAFIKLNANSAVPRTKSFVRAIGYGSISYKNKLPDKYKLALRQVDIPVASQESCQSAYNSLSDPRIISGEGNICAGYKRGGCGACHGDSGGPIIQYSGRTPVVVGVLSFSVRCAFPGFPSVYTRVSSIIPWLRKIPVRFSLN